MGKRLTEEQRGKVAEKIMEWGNLVFVGLVIAQLVPGTAHFRLGIALAGILHFSTAYMVAYYIMMRGGDK